MEKDIRVIEDLRNQIQKGRINFQKTPKERMICTYLNARLDGLEQLITKFLEKHEALIATYSQAELEQSSYVRNNTFDECYETYLIYKGELNAKLATMTLASTSRDTNATSGKKESIAKLPKIAIPFFDGKYSDFSSFKELFNSLVNNNPALDNVQRLHYLKTQLKGEAEQIIKHIPITDSNYKKCWDMLVSRYDNKRFVSNHVLKRLFGQRVMNCESAQALKDLLDTTSDCVHELSNLGIDVSSWDIIIIYVVSQKLDPETRKQWELHVNYSPDDLPSLSMFKNFLESRFRALEFVEPLKSQSKSSSPKVLHATSNVNVTCPHCNDNHKLYSCSNFAKEDVANRQEIVKSLKLCYNCLGSNHFGKACRNPTQCHICNGKHHTLLHGKSKPQAHEEEDLSEQMSETKEPPSIRNHFTKGHSQALLATALVQAEGKHGSKLILRALLDQGSQASFISEEAVKLLRLKKIPAKSCISGLGGTRSGLTSKVMVMVNMQSLCNPTFKLRVKAHVLKSVTSLLPEKKFALPEWADIKHVQLADPQFSTPSKIDMLLGSEVYCGILNEGLLRSPAGSIIAQDTSLGWVLSGQVGGRCGDDRRCHNVIEGIHAKVKENKLLKKFWELEAKSKRLQPKVLFSEEHACGQHFAVTSNKNETGRYLVELPFRSDVHRSYGDGLAVTVKKLNTFKKREAKHPDQIKDYGREINEYLALGHVGKKINNLKQKNEKVLLPHSAVVRFGRNTTKNRVIFNASDKLAPL